MPALHLPAIDPSIRDAIISMRAAGGAFHLIAARLNARGVPSQLGGRWYAASVRRVVTGHANHSI